MADNTETILDTPSPAAKYEALLLEQGGPGLTEDKMVLVFKVLDQIVPHLGVFKQLMIICRDHLFDAVYSEQYTGSSEERRQSKRYIQRVPYFSLTKRANDQRDERNEQLNHQLETVKERLFEVQTQFEEATDTIHKLNQQIADLQGNVADLEANLCNKKAELQQFEEILEEEKTKGHRAEHQMSCDISDLKDDLEEARTDNNYLRKYKQGYDDLQTAFQKQPSLVDVVTRKKKKSAVATKRAHLVSSITSALKLEEQLLTVQNAAIEEFDQFMEEHKTELEEKDAYTNNRELYKDQEMDIDQADEQLAVMEERFKGCIQDIHVELELLRQHRLLLQEQLQVLEENKPAPKKRKKNKQESRPETQESSLSAGLGDEDEDEGDDADPFIPQERIFSKYAAMMYASDNNGRSYHEFKAAKFCASCGEKTVMCPHKILEQEQVFTLPMACTHIKVTRPKVRINMDMMDNMFCSQAAGTDMLTSEGKRFSRISTTAQVSPLVESEETPAGESLPDTSAAGGMMTLADTTHFTHTIQRLWEDYKNRTDLERTVPRSLSLSRTLSLLEQFLAALLWQDELNADGDTALHILDKLYAFFSQRYQKLDVGLLVAHDLVVALASYSATNKTLWLFTQALIGNVDVSVFRYLMLVGVFITEVEWKEVGDFRAFAAALYPWLTEDDLENLQMGYTSFSENKISGSLVADYVVYIIMKYREPRFLEMENKLLTYPGKEAGLMTEQEFVDSSDQCLSVPNDRLRRHLYQEALAYVSAKEGVTGGVPILRLAQICSYLELLHVSELMQEQVGDQVTSARDRDRASSIGELTGGTKYSQQVPPQFEVLTITKVKNLATNVARRDHCRKARLLLMTADEE